MVLPQHQRLIVSLDDVAVARAAKPVLHNLRLEIYAADRIFIAGENGAGKSTLLSLLAGRLHPYGSAGSRIYAWDSAQGEHFRTSRRHIAFIGREEQHRLQRIHAQSSLRDFLLGHLDGADFLYRDLGEAEKLSVDELLLTWQAEHLADRLLGTLSLGEMRLALILRAAMHERQLYILDELFSSLSETVVHRVMGWLRALPAGAAVVMTSHDRERAADLDFNRYFLVADGQLLPHATESKVTALVPETGGHNTAGDRQLLIDCRGSNFFHDFTCIFEDMTFRLHAGDRILLTGPNGAGKSTLLRIMHGDFYPEYDSVSPSTGVTGSLVFSGVLAQEAKSELWQQVQLIAASHFAYYPTYMSVRDVLASRYSGSIYDYPDVLPIEAAVVIKEFSLQNFLPRPFHALSEGEKTRVLFARAFLFAAPVYLIDEGFIALSHPHFLSAIAHINSLPRETAVVIAANERIAEIRTRLQIKPSAWQLSQPTTDRPHSPQRAQLTILA